MMNAIRTRRRGEDTETGLRKRMINCGWAGTVNTVNLWAAD